MSLVCIPRIFCKPGKQLDVAALLPIDDCFKNQPKTHAYYFFSLNKAPSTVLGFELYTDGSGLKEHGTAPSFKAFSKSAAPLFEKPFSLAQAKPVCGFLSKDTESASQILEDKSSVAVLATITCHSAEHRVKFLEAAGKFAETVKGEAGTLTYYWSADLKDATKIFVFERYANEEAGKVHSQNAKAFMKSTKDLIKSADIELGSPVGGYLKKEPSLMESNYTLAPSLAPSLSKASPITSSPAPGSLQSSSQRGRGLSFTAARNGKPQSIAHRGYKALFPENTMIALEGALKSGADGIETDVHLSRDGVVVIAHDPSTDRCYGKPGLVCEQDYGGPGGMATFRTVDPPHSRMPTLREVLVMLQRPEYARKWLLLDIKIDNQVEIIEAMRDVLLDVSHAEKGGGLESWRERIVLGVWHHKLLPYCRRSLPELGITHITLHTSYARSHFLDEEAVGSFNVQLQSLVLASQLAFIREAHDRGKQVYVWTVNAEPAIRFCASLGVDAILTDDPAKLRNVERDGFAMTPADRAWSRAWRRLAWNVFLYLMMTYRIFWQHRHLRSQPYVKPAAAATATTPIDSQ